MGSEESCRLVDPSVTSVLVGGFDGLSMKFAGEIGGVCWMLLEKGSVSKSSREKTIVRFREGPSNAYGVRERENSSP